MEASERIADDEVILRRIPPSTLGMASTKELPNGDHRATSVRLSTKPDEQGLSCTRLKLTSPQQLLAQLEHDGIAQDGWFVCRMTVSDVRSLALEVIPFPTERDPGHCEIRSLDSLAYPNTRNSKLAKKTRILTADEVATIRAGDALDR